MTEQGVLPQLTARLRPYLETAEPLVAAVSGGPDSLALLHALCRVVPPDRLVVAHLHHGLRPEADAEAHFVIATALDWGTAVVIDKADVPKLATDRGWSLEEAARMARYQFLADVAQQEQAACVLTAHHADDQAETILMHLIRGSGLSGLRGMQPASPLPGAGEITLLRPFLQVSREEIETYCRDHDLTPVQDPSNSDIAFFRNKIRHELMPLLAGYNPQIKIHLQQLAAVTSADYAALEEWFDAFWHSIFVEQGQGWIAISRARWLALPLSHKRMALRRAVQTLRPWQTDIGFRPVDQARALIERNVSGLQMDLPGGLRLQVGYRRLIVAGAEAVLPTPFVPQLAAETPLTLPLPGQLAMGNGWLLVADVRPADTAVAEANTDPWTAYIDVSPLDELQVRPRQPGERFQPLGMDGRSAKVKEVMINRKIARTLRPWWPLVATSEHLVWIIGHQLDDRHRVTPATRRMVRLTCKKVT